MTIHETIAAVQQVLDGADRLARLCAEPEGLEQEQLRLLVARVAVELSIDVDRARAGLAGKDR